MALGTFIAQKKVLRVDLETTKGTAVVPSIDLITFDPEMSSTAEHIEQAGAGTGEFMGFNQIGVIGKQIGVCNFRANLKGDGTSVLDPGLDVLMQCCRFSVAAAVYSPVSTVLAQKTCTIYLYEDGLLKRLSGCMGNVTLEYEEGKIVACNFAMQGIYAKQADTAMPTFAPDVTTAPLMGSGTWTIGAKAINIGKLTLDMRNELAEHDDHYVITQSKPMISFDPAAQLTSEHDFEALHLAGTTSALSLSIGSGAGNEITLTAPKLQYSDAPVSGDREGIFTYDINGNCIIDSGNDEVVLTVTGA